MKIIKRLVAISILSVLMFVSTYSSFADLYTDRSPAVWNWVWRPHSSIYNNSTLINPVYNAGTTWNSAQTGFIFSYLTSEFTGGMSNTDNVNAVAAFKFSLANEPILLPSYAAAVTWISKGRYSNFDVLYNMDDAISWTNGNSSTSLDRQGAMTHEFGHVLGLTDITGSFSDPSNYRLPNTSTLPTMYYSDRYTADGTTKTQVTYYFRTLTARDIQNAKNSYARVGQ